MRNLAGHHDADVYIRDELKLAGISIVEPGRILGEVPATICGSLPPFTFRRAWYYWVVTGGIVPLKIAKQLYDEDTEKAVRVEGDCTAPAPKRDVHVYHIDSQVGLKLFVNTVKPLTSVGRQSTTDRPPIVCLCGSSRFVDQMAVLAWELEKEGAIVLSLHLLPTWYEGIQQDHQAEAEGVAEHMDALHLKKIEMADRVIIVDPGGYIGDSTRREIAYAESVGKPVRRLSESKETHHGS